MAQDDCDEATLLQFGGVQVGKVREDEDGNIINRSLLGKEQSYRES